MQIRRRKQRAYGLLLASSYTMETHTVPSGGKPMSWSRDEVIRWVQWCCQYYDISDVDINRFQMNGRALCLLTRDDFLHRVPGMGDVLFHDLSGLKDHVTNAHLEATIKNVEGADEKDLPREEEAPVGSAAAQPMDLSVKEETLHTDSNDDIQSTPLNLSMPVHKDQVSPQISTQVSSQQRQQSIIDVQADQTCSSNSHTPSNIQQTQNGSTVLGCYQAPDQYVQQLSSIASSNPHYIEDRMQWSDCRGQPSFSHANPHNKQPLAMGQNMRPIVQSDFNSGELPHLQHDHHHHHLQSVLPRIPIHANAEICPHPVLPLDPPLPSSVPHQPFPAADYLPSCAVQEHRSSVTSSCSLPSSISMENIDEDGVVYEDEEEDEEDAGGQEKKQNRIKVSTAPLSTDLPCFAALVHPLPTENRPANKTKQKSEECRLLWEFIYELLEEGQNTLVQWDDPENLSFKINNPANLAKMWGIQKRKNNMTYEKLSRALRYYYRMKIICKVSGKRLTYRFMKHPTKIEKGIRGAKPGVPHNRRSGKNATKSKEKASTYTAPEVNAGDSCASFDLPLKSSPMLESPKQSVKIQNAAISQQDQNERRASVSSNMANSIKIEPINSAIMEQGCIKLEASTNDVKPEHNILSAKVNDKRHSFDSTNLGHMVSMNGVSDKDLNHNVPRKDGLDVSNHSVLHVNVPDNYQRNSGMNAFPQGLAYRKDERTALQTAEIRILKTYRKESGEPSFNSDGQDVRMETSNPMELTVGTHINGQSAPHQSDQHNWHTPQYPLKFRLGQQKQDTVNNCKTQGTNNIFEKFMSK